MAKTDKKIDGSARYDGDSFNDLLDRDNVSAPEFIKEESFRFLGLEDSSTDIYTSQEFFDLEVDKMWSKVWQMVCRVEDLPNVGDYVVYELVDWSILVVRTSDDEIKAFYNVCLHRGRKLKLHDGRANEFKCPFHGFSWDLDGKLKNVPCEWDFPQVEENNSSLPSVKVDTWGGFVFINMDENCQSLHDYLEVLPEHFERWRLEECGKVLHVGKVMPCNWKVAAEAFMEAFHAEVTHPHIMPYTADINGRYDIYGDHINRNITPMAVTSPTVKEPPTEQKILDDLVSTSGRITDDSERLLLAEGQNARDFMAQMGRETFSAEDGHDYSDKSDTEMLDAYTYNVFPNLSPWGGFPPNIVYRWRPNGRDPHSCLMEVMVLKRVPKGEKPVKGNKMRLLTDEQKWSDAEELGALGPIFDQDMGNLPYVQQGLRASKNKKVVLANYQEVRIRHFHQTLNKYVNA